MALPSPESGSTCLITGASSGIGAEFGRQLAARGHGVLLVARRKSLLSELAAEIEREHGVRAEFFACDLGDADERDALPGKVAERGLTVEVLVNNAGYTKFGDLHRNPDGQWGQVRLNCEAVVALTSAFLPEMVKRGRGTIVNVASVAAFQPIPVQSVYAASKSFVLSFTEGLSSELKGTGVTVSALCPGPVATEFMEAGGAKRGVDDLPSFIWSSAEEVARAGIKGAERGKRVVIPGIGNRVSALAGQHLPRSVTLGPVSRLYRRSVGE